MGGRSSGLSATDLTIPDLNGNLMGSGGHSEAGLQDASMISFESIGNISLPNDDLEGLQKGFQDLSVRADHTFTGEDSLMENTLIENTLLDDTLNGNILPDNTLAEDTFVNETLSDDKSLNDTLTAEDAAAPPKMVAVPNESFGCVGVDVDDTFHGMNRSAVSSTDRFADTLTDVSQLSALSSLPSAASSSSSDGSANEGKKLENWL